MNIIPKYAQMKPKSKTAASQKIVRRAENNYIQCELKNLHAKKQHTNAELLAIHLQLAEHLPIQTLMEIIEKIKANNKKLMKKKYERLNKKLVNLRAKQSNHKIMKDAEQKFHSRFVNLTEVYINEQEAELLKKGLKHNIESYNQKRELEQTIVDTEVIISRLPTEEQEHARHICRHIIEKDINAKKNRKQKNENQTIKGLKEKLRANNVITTKADKGNTTVLIDKKDYIEKTESLITEIGCNKLGKDPTEEYQAAIKNTIKKSTTIIKDNLPYRLTLMNPSVRPLIALPKTHKPGTPMRPIINHKSAPGYRLSKHLKTLLKDSLDLRNKYTITNTTELIEKMKSLKINENTKFVSFDIKDLYPSIPTIETIKTVQEILMGKMKREAITEIINALKVTLKQNYFRLNNKIYKQINGLGMGNPTSGILMEVFMQTLEAKYMKNLSTNLG
ncbi:uncharacterized protein LOC118732462, partial [Rhagoletis pomonella]|uniref:uncharacterized protein LOC118732462 n=1 Tax=Rhagoletis pomonella TaxID=28610 RepID=UPI0017819473